MTPVLGAIIVAALSALAAFYAAQRKMSGNIDSSEASQLWNESRAIREEYRQRISHGEERQARLEQRVAELEHKNIDLAERNVALLEQQVELQRSCGELRDERDRLLGVVDSLEGRIKERRATDRE